MALHRLTHIIMGVPDVAAAVDYYEEFGLAARGGGVLATRDGGDQLQVVQAPTRRLVEIGIGVDDTDDLGRVATGITQIGLMPRLTDGAVSAMEPCSGVRAIVTIAPRIHQHPAAAMPYNGPGRTERHGRAPGVLRSYEVKPKKLGHCVIGTVNLEATQRFFVDGLGFRVSDYIKGEGVFMRCSIDHHNVLALQSKVNYLHHTSWQVDDVDDVGRGAHAMLLGNPERHVWGLGRHHAGSNFFWYLKDPAGNFSEYYADMDVIPEDEVWEPEVLEGALGLFDWGPPPPPSFIDPEDLAALMTGAHAPR